MNLTELKALALAATQGPWKQSIYKGAGGFGINHISGTGIAHTRGLNHRPIEKAAEDAAYIAAANPSTILSLISQLETCFEALEYYGEISSYHTIIETDLGERARAALGKVGM